VAEGEVEAQEEEGPVCLLVVELLCVTEVSEVPMICEDLKLLCCTFKEVVPLIQHAHDGQHFLVVDLVVVLGRGLLWLQSLRHHTQGGSDSPFQGIESLLFGQAPDPSLGFVGEGIEGVGNIGEVQEAKEGLDLLYLCWGRPFHDSVDLCQIHGDVVFQDDQSKVLNLLSLELAFLWLEKQPPLSEGSKDLVDGLPVSGEGMGVNKDIIHIAYCLAIVDELTEDIVHHCLEHCGGVTQSKKHESWFKQPSVSSECGLPLIIFLDLHIVESPVEIKYGEELGITEAG